MTSCLSENTQSPCTHGSHEFLPAPHWLQYLFRSLPFPVNFSSTGLFCFLLSLLSRKRLYNILLLLKMIAQRNELCLLFSLSTCWLRVNCYAKWLRDEQFPWPWRTEGHDNIDNWVVDATWSTKGIWSLCDCRALGRSFKGLPGMTAYRTKIIVGVSEKGKKWWERDLDGRWSNCRQNVWSLCFRNKMSFSLLLNLLTGILCYMYTSILCLMK